MATPQSRPRARAAQVVRTVVDDELVVYDTATHAAHALTAEGRAVFERCDGTRDVDELARKTGLDTAQVRAVLRELEAASLLERPLLRRRELGPATLAAAAFVTTIVVPRAAAAASCTPLLGNCASLPCCPGLICILQGVLRRCL